MMMEWYAVNLAATSMISTAGFTALAVFGEGGPTPFFEHNALTAVVAVTAGFAAASLPTSGNLNPGKQEDRSNRWVLGAFGLLGLISAWLPAYTDRKDFWTIGGEGVRRVGVVTYAAGGVLRLWPVFVLGKRRTGAWDFNRFGTRSTICRLAITKCRPIS
jgi:hypothetical protein